ncbi:MAG: Acyl-CoA dehydrogenase FadE27 [Frankiales bacterium]|nr:Acyl-CoA dehydrogenase FadE27 [Frankiales bacterium]
MDLRPSPEQQQLVDAFASLYAAQSPSDRVRAAEPLGHLPELWSRLRETGAVEMAVPAEQGGWGASLLDLALVAEQHGRWIAPAPLIEAQVAARLLARVGADLAQVLSGEKLVTLAVRPAQGSSATLVPAGAVADQAIVLTGERLVLVDVPSDVRLVENVGCLPLADLTVPETATLLGEGPTALQAYATALDEWRVLTAAALSGIAARALEIGIAYVKERQAFGQPIGAFQGVAHRLADRACEVDGAELLAREAAWAAAEDPGRAAELAAMAFAFAAETARDTTYHALHFHGGYGFMLEYDIQLYFRRARTWPGVLCEPRAAYRQVSDTRYAAAGS